MFKLVSSRVTPSYRGVGPPLSQVASYPLLPAGTKPIFKLKEARDSFDADRAKQFKVITALFNSKEAGESWLKMRDNPVFVHLARFPDVAKNLSVLKEYMKNNYFWVREEIEGRQGRIETIPADELGTKLYEQQRLDKYKSYISGPYADYLRKLELDPMAPSQPDEATKAYAALLKEPKTYIEATVVRAACAVGWSMALRRILDDNYTVKKGPFYEGIMLENVTDSFTYFKDTGEEAVEYVTTGYSGTARRLSEQIDGRLLGPDGVIVWDEPTRKRLADLTRRALDAEYNMFLASWVKVYGAVPVPPKV
ncbi:hypothetical protein B0T26DRAFT_755175 [Lasiosphaeria miniovina]|uniref:Uncharacterized protein n=1 Tax=Lasiosphaeria miniovina TaxID=1954250 RepID=A0AA40A6H4_9PEZI|nr:uncharacterized protein B0T26DRAFT_755175 [Lasiosphaeria miniovina]KAK0710053.1 hypothetical protein B0T26DRAFT_755175 [Lasiosphaeria miniovina]